ncbi:unnamed protein product, partial [Adineta ricciae]
QQSSSSSPSLSPSSSSDSSVHVLNDETESASTTLKKKSVE